MKQEFSLHDSDRYAIQIAIDVARTLIARPGIAPEKVISIGKALLALERLPSPTENIWIEFGVSLRQGEKGNSELRYLHFGITEDFFEISRGGSTCSPQVGSDSYSLPGYRIELDGYRNGELDDFWSLQDEVQELLGLGAEIEVNDEFANQLPTADSDLEV